MKWERGRRSGSEQATDSHPTSRGRDRKVNLFLRSTSTTGHGRVAAAKDGDGRLSSGLARPTRIGVGKESSLIGLGGGGL